MENLIEYKVIKRGENIWVRLFYREFLLGRVQVVPSAFKGLYVTWRVDLKHAPYFSITKDDIKRLAGDYLLKRGYKMF